MGELPASGAGDTPSPDEGASGRLATLLASVGALTAAGAWAQRRRRQQAQRRAAEQAQLADARQAQQQRVHANVLANAAQRQRAREEVTVASAISDFRAWYLQQFAKRPAWYAAQAEKLAAREMLRTLERAQRRTRLRPSRRRRLEHLHRRIRSARKRRDRARLVAHLHRAAHEVAQVTSPGSHSYGGAWQRIEKLGRKVGAFVRQVYHQAYQRVQQENTISATPTLAVRDAVYDAPPRTQTTPFVARTASPRLWTPPRKVTVLRPSKGFTRRVVAHRRIAPRTRLHFTPQEYTDRLRMKLFPEGPNDPPCPPGMLFVPPDGCRQNTWPPGLFASAHDAWQWFWLSPEGKTRLAHVAFLQRKSGDLEHDWYLAQEISEQYGVQFNALTSSDQALRACQQCWEQWGGLLEEQVARSHPDFAYHAQQALQDCLAQHHCPHEHTHDWSYSSDYSSEDSISPQGLAVGVLGLTATDDAFVGALGLAAADGPFPIGDAIGVGLLALAIYASFARKKDLKQVDAAAREAGIPKRYRRAFGQYIEQEKEAWGGPDLTWDELLDLAEAFKEENGLTDPNHEKDPEENGN